jgi:peptide/nickel transport system substrate-binding protein
MDRDTGGNVQHSPRATRRTVRFLAVVAGFAMVAAACGGGSSNKGSSNGGTSGNEGTPKEGGKVVYALEGKTTMFCIPSAQLAISGIMVTQAIYDTLMEPDANGNLQPYLAKSVTHNPTYDQWTITLRPGIKFHDGEPLDANAVAQNINAWRKGVLLQFVYQNISDVTVTDPMTVVVKLAKPWIAFPLYLWTTGRTGIAAPAQLNNQATCNTNMIGTGPFKLKSFDPATGEVDAVKNPDYWRKDSAGRQLPYLNEIDFKIQEDGQQRTRGLQGGQFDLMHDSNGTDLKTLQGLGSQFNIDMEPKGRQELGHLLINVSRPPMDNLACRKAFAEGIDRKILNNIYNQGLFRIADQVFDTNGMGYVSDPGFPKFDVTQAKKDVATCKAANGGKFVFNVQSTFDQLTQTLAQEVQRQAKQIGITVNLPAPVDQATIINQAIGGQVDAFLWRNYPGGDGDSLYVWFHSKSPVNFNHVSDPELDKDLDEARSEPDNAKRVALYQDFNRRMSSQAYNQWTWYTQWFVGSKTSVHGLGGPNLPDETGKPGTDKPIPMIAGYHQLLGIWVS